MYLKTILVLYIIFINNVIKVNGDREILKCEKQGFNITNDNTYNTIIKDTVLNNITYVIDEFNNNSFYKKHYKNGFKFVTPIENNKNSFGIGIVYIKSFSTTLNLLNHIVNKMKKKCINNDYLKGNYDDGKDIKICYDLYQLYSNNTTKTICDDKPKWFK